MYIKIIILLLLSNVVSAQKGIIKYGFIQTLGGGNAQGPDSNAYMVFNKEQSYYVTAKDSLENAANINEQRNFTSENGNMSIYNGIKVSKQGDQVTYNIKKNTIWSNILYRKQIYVKETATKFNWKIINETKKIGSFVCKKATTKFRGRSYIVWYTPDIPLPFGPWKLNGLPGIILEAYDTDKNVYWFFKSATYPSNTSEKVKYMTIPANLKWLSYSEFKKVQNSEIERATDRNKLINKEFPNITMVEQTLNEMFLECE